MATGDDPDQSLYNSHFSIRDFVFSARSKDITINWPFSHNNLQLCLNHGVKDVLPPFQPIDSLRETTIKRCLEQKCFYSEESNQDAKSSMLKNNVGLCTIPDADHSCNQAGEDYRDSDTSPTKMEGNLAVKKTLVMANSQSEVESVSTSNLPSSESSAVANNKAKSSASQPPNKKCKVAVKMRLNNKRNTPEDITSACTAPPEAISSKICPVCENFSSSSNTTLNAHIDQCLSSQSLPTWVKSCKLSKPRIKPRKMRLMTDICATAPCCTLEDLDRRNGTNWATNTDFPLEDADMSPERNAPRVSSRCIINNVDDDSVYIDSSGTKIRILSKCNDLSPLSLSKSSEDLKLKKQSVKAKRSKLFSSNRKKRLAKHLKHMKVTHKRNCFSSLKVCGTEEALHEMRDGHKKQERSDSSIKGLKVQGQHHLVVWTADRGMSFKMSNILKENNSEAMTNSSGCEIQEAKDSLIGNDQDGSAQVTGAKYNFRFSSYRSGLDSRSKVFRRGKKSSAPSLRSAVGGNRDAFKVSLKLRDAEVVDDIINGSTPKSLSSSTLPAPLLESETDVQPNAPQNPSEGIRSHKSKTDTPEPNKPCAHVSQSIFDQIDSVSCEWSGDRETETCSAEASQQSGAIMNLPKSRRIADSLGRSSLTKVRQKQVQEHGHEGIEETKRSNASHDTHDNNGCHKSSMEAIHSDEEFIGPVSASNLATGVHEVELKNCANLSPQSESLQRPSKFQGRLYGEAKSRSDVGQLGQSDEQEIFYGNVVDADNMSLREGDYILDFGVGNFLAEVDPIPIPGPPGSDLPSFSDIGSEDLHKSSQSDTLAQPSGDGHDDPSESPLSATSTISNFGRRDNYSFTEQKSLSASESAPYNIYAGGLGANPGLLTGISTAASQFTSVERERATNCCVNSLEKCAINLAWMNPQESQFLRDRQTSSDSFSGVLQTNCTLNAQSNVSDDRPVVFSTRSYHISESSLETNRDIVPLSRTSDYDSACPAPILRLMGKDLMVSNSMETDLSRSPAVVNVGVNGLVLPVGEISSRVESWKHSSSVYPAFMGALLHGQDPHFPPSFGTYNQASGSMDVNQPMHASFSPSLGTPPLQR